ncbi:phosphonopyruvate decarboxylase [Kosakonia quasisacchari]|uniref:Phosphonopyruvate decarboxylase n=1 Tax=Kosakonia quasisacchari TaxID=2529380 RepID=A0A4R0HI12_9ENTR|nr:phosphonopyruvate decarboxylase [Kosakonia quasisacchari]TCC09270.1 phosphonopyruvate decarboxylase [Kosakonia quasisacchari]
MLSAKDIYDRLATLGPLFMTGVPCSYLTTLMNEAILSANGRYVGASSEGEAVAIGTGARLAGKVPVVLMQNSGLGNAVNPLTSLNNPFRIPCLLIISWRGEPGKKDEPQHAFMGSITRPLLDLLAIPNRVLSGDAENLQQVIDAAKYYVIEQGQSFAIIVPDGVIEPGDVVVNRQPPPSLISKLSGNTDAQAMLPTRAEVLALFQQWSPGANAAVIISTGKGGRELYSLDDRPGQFYQVGSMGCASGMALGVALNTGKQVIVFDGDGALLMKLGSLATIGSLNPKNLLHVVLDNGVHDSTGGQPTAPFEFSQAASAAGYRYCYKCEDILSLHNALHLTETTGEGSSFIHMKIASGSLSQLPRPSISPSDVARRFRDFIFAKN